MNAMKLALPILVIVALVAVTGCTDTRSQCCEYGSCCNEKITTSVVTGYKDFTGVYSAHFVDMNGVDYGVPLNLNINPANYHQRNITFGYKCENGRNMITRVIRDNSA